MLYVRRVHALFFLLISFLLAGNGLAAQVPDSDILLLDIEWNDRGRPVLKNPVWVTEREGYDNQPSFDPTGEFVLYTSVRNGQADIYRYVLDTGDTTQMTSTPESEYSPIVTPGGAHFSVVAVESDDSTQRIWRFPLADAEEERLPRIVMETINPVGYYTWLDENYLAMFILGKDRNSMMICHRRKQKPKVVSGDIGRCIQTIPGVEAASFTVQRKEYRAIRKYDHKSGKVTDICKALPESEDYCWTPDGKILMGSGSRLYFFNPKGDQRWHLGFELLDLGISNFNRLAISPKGDKIALVVPR